MSETKESMAFDPFTGCFTALKLRYRDYDESLTSKNFLKEDDKVSVYINLETVFKHLSMIYDLEKKVVIQRDIDEILISNIINLAAHYKKFFIDNGLDTKVYIYSTDLNSNEFNQTRYNEDYRSYYLVKYNDNPKFVLLTEHLKDKVLPDVKTYCEFIPNVYYISAKNIEGSLIPYIISRTEPDRKNLIIGGDFFDTQYSFIDNFVNHYIHRGFNISIVCSELEGYIKDLTKKTSDEISDIVPTYGNYPAYCTLMSVIGSQIRSIDGISGVGPIKLQKLIESGIIENLIQSSTVNPVMIGEIFHDDEIKEEFINNYYCCSILPMYQELTDGEIMSIITQKVDRIDINTLKMINSTKFYNHPLLLEGLLI